MTSKVSEILAEAARSTLLKYNLAGSELEDGVAAVMAMALRAPEVQRKFAYALTDKAVVAQGKGEATVVEGTGLPASSSMPSLILPNVVRFRQRKLKLRIDHYMQSGIVELFNKHYAKEIDFDFSYTLNHDHPEAAASRKIEQEVVMSMLKARGADLLRVPTNGCEFSVIDVGGDWRYHAVRNHHGVHIDAPFLDERDRARDARKRLQLKADDANNDRYVCRNKMQDCLVTAPYMMAVHSVLYTTPLLEICEAMAVRGSVYFIGTMQLPEGLDKMYTRYTDPDYGYVIDFVDRAAKLAGEYLPAKARAGIGKYLYRNESEVVRYTYPAGESKAYEHDRHILVEKLHDSVFDVPISNGDTQTYKYRILKRVGSLIYAEIYLDQTFCPPHIEQMERALPKPFDGYQVVVDENLLRDFHVKVGRGTTTEVARQLFTAVSAYCLTKVGDTNFSIETAISYARSASSQIESNGVIVHKGSGSDRYVNVVVAGLSAFFWAFDRYRLMTSRLTGLGLADARAEVESSIAGRMGTFVGFGQISQTLRDAGKKILSDSMANYVVSRGTTFNDLRQLYERVSSAASPGVSRIRDMSICYQQLQPLRTDGDHVRNHVSSANVSAFEAVLPVYELEPSTKVETSRAESDLARSGATSETAVAESTKAIVKPLRGMHSRGASKIDIKDVRPIIMDSINLVEAGEAERDQTARQIFAKVFDIQTRTVHNMEVLKGTVKGRPTLLHYIDGELVKVQTLEESFLKGTERYDELVKILAGSRAIYPEKSSEGVGFGTGVLHADGSFRSDKKRRTGGQSFTALIDPELRVLNAAKLYELRTKIGFDPIYIDESRTLLANEVAGSGKTHSQCVQYKERLTNSAGNRAAILASTKAAADQAAKRLAAWGVDFEPDAISTVDSFLMNSKKWLPYSLVLVDEALQLHAGKIYAIAYLTGAEVKGYGDSYQIEYINFTRFHKPAVETSFPWGSVEANWVTRRLPHGQMLEGLKSDKLYGHQLSTTRERANDLAIYVQTTSVEEKITVPVLYQLMGLDKHQELHIMVYMQEELNRLVAKLQLPRRLPEKVDGSHVQDYPCSLSTIGEAQGEDVDNAFLLRLSTKQEPLHSRRDQTIVAVTRHKRRFGYWAVTSKFPSLLEEVYGAARLVSSVQSAMAARTVIS